MRISPEASKILKGHRWDGNIRELENAILGAVAVADDTIYPEHLPTKLTAPMATTKIESADANTLVDSVIKSGDVITMGKMEELYAKAVLEHVGGNKQAAARILDIDRKTLVRMVTRGED
jgi:DNA-binding NtrC family response regulator